MSGEERSPRTVGVVPAAGSGRRYGGDGPKQLAVVAGRPVLAWAIDRLLAGGCDEVVVAVPAGDEERVGELLGRPRAVRLVAGGATRQESVARCLDAIAASAAARDLVAVHDGARPAVAVDDVRAVIAAATGADGAVLGRPLDDTLKRVEDGRIVATVNRDGLFRAETPQAFPFEVLAEAHRVALRDAHEATDEAGLVERLPGLRVVAVAASAPNPKLTRPADRELVERLLTEGSP